MIANQTTTLVDPFIFSEKTGSGVRISGQITSAATGNPIQGATITLADNCGPYRQQATGISGVYDFFGLPDGDYTVVVNATGYTTTTVGVTINATAPIVTKNFTMVSAAGAQTITVFALGTAGADYSMLAAGITVAGSAPQVHNLATTGSFQFSGPAAGSSVDCELGYVDPFGNFTAGTSPTTVVAVAGDTPALLPVASFAGIINISGFTWNDNSLATSAQTAAFDATISVGGFPIITEPLNNLRTAKIYVATGIDFAMTCRIGGEMFLSLPLLITPQSAHHTPAENTNSGTGGLTLYPFNFHYLVVSRPR